MTHKDLNHDNKSMKEGSPIMYFFMFHIACFSMRTPDSNFLTYFKAKIHLKFNIYANIFGLCAR